jgi:hypothetical protein
MFKHLQVPGPEKHKSASGTSVNTDEGSHVIVLEGTLSLSLSLILSALRSFIIQLLHLFHARRSSGETFWLSLPQL